MQEKVKVLIVEDQAMPRQLFELFIKTSDRFEVVATCDNASLWDIYLTRYHVDLILMDVITKNGENGIEAAEAIKKKFPQVKIIIVTSMPEFSFIQKAKDIGCEGFWYKNDTEENIINLMNRIMDGKKIYPKKSPVIKIGEITSDKLTKRELEVLKEMTAGYNNQEIGEHLFMSLSTVKRHVEHLLQKTGYKNRIELAVKARESGIVIFNHELDDIKQEDSLEEA